MKTSKCHLIYRNISKTSDRNNEKNLKVDKIEFFWNFPRNVFCALLLPCLRGLKSVISATMSALYHLPATTNLSMFGKWFLVRFFGILHRRFLNTSLCRVHMSISGDGIAQDVDTILWSFAIAGYLDEERDLIGKLWKRVCDGRLQFNFEYQRQLALFYAAAQIDGPNLKHT